MADTDTIDFLQNLFANEFFILDDPTLMTPKVMPVRASSPPFINLRRESQSEKSVYLETQRDKSEYLSQLHRALDLSLDSESRIRLPRKDAPVERSTKLGSSISVLGRKTKVGSDYCSSCCISGNVGNLLRTQSRLQEARDYASGNRGQYSGKSQVKIAREFARNQRNKFIIHEVNQS